jgi:glyoxylase-like metal-dependent hydrolase (beta-lactamase superfamily II)
VTHIAVPGYDIVGIRAPNGGPFTLLGTNSWLTGRDPAWLIDPGPDLESHVAALCDEIDRRGGLAGIALTHSHPDHVDALAKVKERYPRALVAAAAGEVDVLLREGTRFGPLDAVLTPGHARDHVSLITGNAAFTGDAVLGQGSVYVSPYSGALAAYLAGIDRLRKRDLEVLCPGHGPLVLDAIAKLDQYSAHRREREKKLLSALAAGKRTVEALLDAVWSDVPAERRSAAAWTLAAHLDKLDDERRLPDGVERPALSGASSGES